MWEIGMIYRQDRLRHCIDHHDWRTQWDSKELDPKYVKLGICFGFLEEDENKILNDPPTAITRFDLLQLNYVFWRESQLQYLSNLILLFVLYEWMNEVHILYGIF